MSESLLDFLGGLLWCAVFVTPLITIPVVWRLMDTKKVVRVIVGLLLAFFLSVLLYFLSLAIIFRNGMGPV